MATCFHAHSEGGRRDHIDDFRLTYSFFTMKSFASLSFLLLPVVLAHGDSHGKPEAWKDRKAGESDYAMRHVSQSPFNGCRSSCTDCSIYLDGHGASHVMIILPHSQIVTHAGKFSDTFDTQSFFQLHDLNRCVCSACQPKARSNVSCSDGFWDREETEAIYGVHHVYSQKKSKVEPFGTISLWVT